MATEVEEKELDVYDYLYPDLDPYLQKFQKLQLQNKKLLQALALNQQNQQKIQNRLFNSNNHGHGYVDYNYHAEPYYYYCSEDQVNLGILLVTAASIPLMFYTLYTKILASGGRRKRSSDPQGSESWFSFNFWDYFDASK